MNDSDIERKARADERRKRMKVRFTTLDDQSDPWPIFGADAVDLAADLTRQVWALSGRPFPNYRRSEIPIRFSDFDPE